MTFFLSSAVQKYWNFSKTLQKARDFIHFTIGSSLIFLALKYVPAKKKKNIINIMYYIILHTIYVYIYI